MQDKIKEVKIQTESEIGQMLSKATVVYDVWQWSGTIDASVLNGIVKHINSIRELQGKYLALIEMENELYCDEQDNSMGE